MESFDYIVIGAGTAGAVMAARLSEVPGVSVLLLEAGQDSGGFWSALPLGVGKVLNDSDRTWRLKTEPDSASASVARDWVSGKCLGGSSSVNGLVYVRGPRLRYDAWGRICAGWSYQDCLQYFRKLERWPHGNAAGERGEHGPVRVSLADPDPISERFLAACGDLGYQSLDDYNVSDEEGMSYLQLATARGWRCGAARAYLAPIRKRPNLYLRRRSLVRRILFAGQSARGVVVCHGGSSEREYTARREVILCAGAVRSPQLLQVSGVGPRGLLGRFGIPLVHDNDAVGSGLQDHLMARICYRTGIPYTVNAMVGNTALLLKELARFLFAGKGILSTTSLKAHLFAKSHPQATVPDLRIQIGLVSAVDRIPRSARDGLDPGSAFHIGVYNVYPESRGHVLIRGAAIEEPPLVQPAYLHSERDRTVMVHGLKMVRQIASQPPLADIIQDEIRPGTDVAGDHELLAYAEKTGQTCWHPIGTCRMGSEAEGGVVDQQCRVHGVQSLRVVDASVFPHFTASNTNVPTNMLAEKIAGEMLGGWDVN